MLSPSMQVFAVLVLVSVCALIWFLWFIGQMAYGELKDEEKKNRKIFDNIIRKD